MTDQDPNRDPRVYLAEERTFLAWIRTGLSLMAFGFVVARFGFFLREIEAARGTPPVKLSTLSVPLGVGLLAVGVLVNVGSAWRHVQIIRALNRGTLALDRPSRLGIALATLLAAVGLAMAFYLAIAKTADP